MARFNTKTRTYLGPFSWLWACERPHGGRFTRNLLRLLLSRWLCGFRSPLLFFPSLGWSLLSSLGRFRRWSFRFRELVVLRIFTILGPQGEPMPASPFIVTKLAGPDRQRGAFGRLYTEALHVVPAAVDGSDYRRKRSLEVYENLIGGLGEGAKFDGTRKQSVNTNRLRKKGGWSQTCRSRGFDACT
jgi:hypothetical protein